MPEVIVYSTPTCTYCNAAKEYLSEHNVEFEEYDLSVDMDRAQRIINATGQMGVPVIEIDGEFIIGFDKPKLASALGL